MNRHKLHSVLVCVSLFLFYPFPQRNVYAQDPDFAEIPLETLHDDQPVELLGLFSDETLNISVPQSWLPGKANWLEFKARASPLLDSGKSFITLSLNGFHVGSYHLGEIAGTKRKIPIPANMFSQGNNILTFSAALYLPDDQETNCQGWDDPARWLTIEPGGVLHLSFVRRDLPIDFANFPQLFIEPLERFLPDRDERQTLFVMPEDSTQDDLTALSIVSYVLGSVADVQYDWHPEIVIGKQFSANLAANRNVVFIGQIPSEFEGMANGDKNYVALVSSPWGKGYAVLIIGDQNREDGFTPASVFSDPARNILLHGKLAYVDQHPLSPPEPLPKNVSFEDLGYLDRTVRSIGKHNLIYSLYVPYETDPALVKLNLELVHSPDLDIQNSSFTIYLNGFSVAGILPTEGTSTGAPITAGLPAKRFRPGINFIRIRSDLHLPFTSCERAPESVWATILNSTTLEITYRNRAPIPSLKHFPLPFSEYPGFTYVIPDQYGQNDLVHISRLSFMIGSSAYAVNYPPRAMTASDLMHKEADIRNIIIVGLPSENQATLNINDLLPQPFAMDGKSLQEGFGIYLPTSDKEASLGLMQIIPSPWVTGGTVLVLTGTDQQGLDWIWDVILNPALREQFTGNLMVVGSANRSNTSGGIPAQENLLTLFQQIADASNIPIIGAILQKSGQAFLGPALGAVGTALLLVACVLWIRRVVDNRKRSGTIEKKDER